MEVTALCFRLLMLEIIQLGTQVQKGDATFLRITPNRLQHFEYDSVSFDCLGFDDLSSLKVIRKTVKFKPGSCDIKRTPAGNFCTINFAFLADSGEYLCETDGGERSNSVNITVTAGSVILESPALPVKEGEDVTLRCRKKMILSNMTTDFYKDGVFIGRSSTGDMTIPSVLKSDGGLYKCRISDGELAWESPESWLIVRYAAFLRITPNRLQHFQYDSVSFDCDGFDDSIQLRRIRNTEELTPACAIKRTPTGSFCTIDNAYPGDSGEYWCETDGGERSNSVNITVTAGSVILESPVLPVKEGEDVTLCCRKNMILPNMTADFYKDGVFIGRSSTGDMTILSVLKSDDGLYKCNISDVGESPESWLTVRDAAFLRITPNRLQHFQYDSVSIDCDGFDNSIQLRGIRNTEELTPTCNIKRTPTGSFCTIDRVYPEDSGEYWCETDGGERSNSVNITVTAGSVILESPVLPVKEGEDVTLCCRRKMILSNMTADFYKDGVFIGRTSTGHMTVHSVLKSDEGLYKCSISDFGESPESWLTVRDAPFLRITPNRLQHFQYHSVSIDCVGFDGSIQLRQIGNAEELTPACAIKRTPTGSFCTIDNAYPEDSGEYWCETDGGERSNSVNITVTAGSVILESPVLPVKEGEDVTLRCRKKMILSNMTADFYKDGVFIGRSFTGDMTIPSVLKYHEGLYKCNISDGEFTWESPESWLTVRAAAVSDAPEGAPLMSVYTLIGLVVAGAPYLLPTIILGLLYRDKRRAHQLVAKDRIHDVIMEIE